MSSVRPARGSCRQSRVSDREPWRWDGLVRQLAPVLIFLAVGALGCRNEDRHRLDVGFDPIPDSAQALADAVDTDATGTSDVATLDAARDSDADTAEPALRDSGADSAEPDLRDSGDDTPEPDLEQPECESRV